MLEKFYFSRALGLEQPFACLLPDVPPPANRSGYPLLILLHGLTGCHRDWLSRTRIVRALSGEGMAVACPYGADGWYTNAVRGGPRYEEALVQDFVSACRSELPVLPPGRAWAIGGLSMGGYGAVKLALKFPELFGTAFSLSGAFLAPAAPQPHPVFGDPAADAVFRRGESVFYHAELALCRMPGERPTLFLECGLQDPLLEESRAFHDHLNFLGYGHAYRELAGYHTWPYWERAFRMLAPDITRVVHAAACRTEPAQKETL